MIGFISVTMAVLVSHGWHPLAAAAVMIGFGIAFGDGSVPTPRQVEERGEKWRPYRTVASWYLWRAAEATTL